jgi:hypothetical protein
MTFSIIYLIVTFSIREHSITAQGIVHLTVTFSINNYQHNTLTLKAVRITTLGIASVTATLIIISA